MERSHYLNNPELQPGDRGEWREALQDEERDIARRKALNELEAHITEQRAKVTRLVADRSPGAFMANQRLVRLEAERDTLITLLS